MRLHVMSDLHSEHRNDRGRGFFEGLAGNADVLVLAGDCWSLRNTFMAEPLIEIALKKYKYILYVPGNHEYYGTSPSEVNTNLMVLGMKFPNFKVLKGGQVLELEGKRFLGGTLWFPERPDDIHYRGLINDFSAISKFVPWVYGEYLDCLRGLEANLKEGDIVITHHMPTDLSTHSAYKGSPINRFFHVDLDNLIFDRKPRLWVHGHTHESFDYRLGQTRILCNPLGYPNERKFGSVFNPQLYVDI